MVRKFPVSVPASNRTTQLTNRNLTAAINRGRLVAERARELAGERHRLISQRLHERQARKQEAEIKFDRFLAQLSTVQRDRHVATTTWYVARGGDVMAVASASLSSTIKRHLNGVTTSGVVAFSGEQLDRFKAPDGTFLKDIPPLNLSKLLELGNRRPGHGNPPSRSLVVLRCPTARASKSLRGDKEAKDVGHATIHKDHWLNLRRRKTMLLTGLLLSPSKSLTSMRSFNVY